MRSAALGLVALLALAAPAAAGPLEQALARARREDRAVVVEFRADWCGPCRVFEQHVLAHPWVRAQLRTRIFVSIDIDPAEGAAVARRYRVVAVPTFISLDPSGRELERSSGILEVLTPQAFIAFFERAEARREVGRRSSDPRVARFAAGQVEEARRAPGTPAAGWALARAAMLGHLSPAERSALFELHAGATTSERQLAFTIYAALAAGSPADATPVADRLVELEPMDSAALAAAAHAYLEVGRRRAAHRVWHRCMDGARVARERAACRTVMWRAVLGQPPRAVELIRHAVRLRALAELERGDSAVAVPAERAAEEAVWGITPEGAIARGRAAPGWIPPGTLWLRRGLAVGLVGFRADGGLSGEGRFQVGGLALLALRSGSDVKPMGLATGALGIDFADELVYEGAAQLGFAAAGGLIGIYSGLAASDHGAGDDGALGVPIELALFFPGRRFGAAAFVRTTILFAGDQARRTGSNDAPLGADELALGIAARVPDTPLLVGVRHDQLMGRTLTGVWLGVQLAP